MDYRVIDKSEILSRIGKNENILACTLENIGDLPAGVHRLDYLRVKTVANLIAEKNVVFYEKK